MQRQEVRYEALDPETRLDELKSAGVDPMLAELQTGYERAIAAQLLDLVTGDVALLSGSAPTAAGDFLRGRASDWAAG